MPKHHTWSHIALAIYVKASWVKNPQVALMTLKRRAHTCSSWLCKDTLVKFKSLQLPSSELELPLGWEVKRL